MASVAILLDFKESSFEKQLLFKTTVFGIGRKQRENLYFQIIWIKVNRIRHSNAKLIIKTDYII